MKVAELFEAWFDPAQGQHDVLKPESKKIDDTKDDEHLVQIITENCGEMLKAYQQTGLVLYRGIRDETVVIKSKIHQDRKPVEMEEKSHQKLHQAFLAAGLKATRMNSIFCTTNIDKTRAWGSVYVIFVKDGWTGTVFESVKDGYTFFKMREIGSGDDIERMKEEILKMRPKSFSSTSELAEVLKGRYDDVLITGDSYIAVRNYYFKDKLAEKLEIKLK
jgi:hypothetical protein